MTRKVRSHGGLELTGTASIDGLEIETATNLPSTMGKGRLLNISGRLNFATDNSVAGSNVQQIAYLSDIPVAINGKDGSKIISISGTPGNALGVNGDIAIDNTTNDWYQKISGSWSKQGSLKGADGANGSALLILTADPVAAQGKNGDACINTTTGDVFSKASNTWAKQGNIKGPKGDNGVNSLLSYKWVMSGLLSGTTVIPYDNTPPLSTEGSEAFRLTHAATELNSILELEVSGLADSVRRNTPVIIAIFRDDVLLDWGAMTSNNTGNSPFSIHLKSVLVQRDLQQHTYVVRIGSAASSNTWYLGRGNTMTMGTINESYFTLREMRGG